MAIKAGTRYQRWINRDEGKNGGLKPVLITVEVKGGNSLEEVPRSKNQKDLWRGWIPNSVGFETLNELLDNFEKEHKHQVETKQRYIASETKELNQIIAGLEKAKSLRKQQQG